MIGIKGLSAVDLSRFYFTVLVLLIVVEAAGLHTRNGANPLDRSQGCQASAFRN